MAEAVIVYTWMFRENFGTYYLSCLIYSIEANMKIIWMLFTFSLFSTNSQCIDCIDAHCNQVTQSQVGGKKSVSIQQFYCLKDSVLILQGHWKKKKPWICLSSIMQPFVAPGGAELERGDVQGPAWEVHMTSCFRRRVAHEGVPSMRFQDCPCDTWCQAVTRFADYTSDAWKSAGGVSGSGGLCSPPQQPWHQHFGFVLLLDQPDSNKQTELWRVSIAHSSCFNVLLLTKAKQRDRSLWLKGVCMVNHSRPAASLSSLIFFHRSVSYFTARPAPPPKPSTWLTSTGRESCTAHSRAHGFLPAV